MTQSIRARNGLALLTKKVLPGVPLTTVNPLEKIKECIMMMKKIESLPCLKERRMERLREFEGDTQPDNETRLVWIDEDIGYLYDLAYGLAEGVDQAFGAISQRIDDMVILMGRESLEEEITDGNLNDMKPLNDPEDRKPEAEPAPKDSPPEGDGDVPTENGADPEAGQVDGDNPPSLDSDGVTVQDEPGGVADPGALDPKDPPEEPHQVTKEFNFKERILYHRSKGATNNEAHIRATMECLNHYEVNGGGY